MEISRYSVEIPTRIMWQQETEQNTTVSQVTRWRAQNILLALIRENGIEPSQNAYVSTLKSLVAIAILLAQLLTRISKDLASSFGSELAKMV